MNTKVALCDLEWSQPGKAALAVPKHFEITESYLQEQRPCANGTNTIVNPAVLYAVAQQLEAAQSQVRQHNH